MNEKAAIAGRLRAAIKSLGRPQASIAAELGVSQQSLSSWVNGQFEPSLTVLAKICQLTGVSADEILGVKDLQPKPSIPPHVVEKLVQEIDAVTRITQRAAATAEEALRALSPGPAPKAKPPRRPA